MPRLALLPLLLLTVACTGEERVEVEKPVLCLIKKGTENPKLAAILAFDREHRGEPPYLDTWEAWVAWRDGTTYAPPPPAPPRTIIMKRDTLMGLLADETQQEVPFFQNYENGRVAAAMVLGFDGESLFAAVGLEPLDNVYAVDDVHITSSSAIHAALVAASERDRARIKLRREGVESVVYLSIVDA